MPEHHVDATERHYPERTSRDPSSVAVDRMQIGSRGPVVDGARSEDGTWCLGAEEVALASAPQGLTVGNVVSKVQAITRSQRLHQGARTPSRRLVSGAENRCSTPHDHVPCRLR
jgi:hypothetical protein